MYVVNFTIRDHTKLGHLVGPSADDDDDKSESKFVLILRIYFQISSFSCVISNLNF